jgi:hypothetical protein
MTMAIHLASFQMGYDEAVAAERERCITATLTPMTLTPEQEAQLIPGKTAASIFPPRALVEVGWGIAMEFMRAAIKEGKGWPQKRR